MRAGSAKQTRQNPPPGEVLLTHLPHTLQLFRASPSGVALPAVCMSEPDIAFLIRTAGGRWIGNGTVLR
jgi:hypothetical protein